MTLKNHYDTTIIQKHVSIEEIIQIKIEGKVEKLNSFNMQIAVYVTSHYYPKN